MRFFTPELYIQFNSPDDDEADRGDAAWEAAIRDYGAHLAKLRERMPSQVRSLADLCLHDAEFLVLDQAIESFFPFPIEPFGPYPFWAAVAILSVKQDGKILSLIYLLWDRVREHQPKEGWPFSKLRTHLLYDEIDVAPSPRDLFLHRVLFSDGKIIEVPFMSAVIHHVPLPVADESGVARHSA